MSTITKQELIDRISESTQTKQTLVKAVIENFLVHERSSHFKTPPQISWTGSTGQSVPVRAHEASLMAAIVDFRDHVAFI